MKQVADRIKELRGSLTQAQAAEKLGFTQQAWARYESGACEPNAKTIKQLCVVFGTTADWLLGLSGESADAKAAVVASSRIAELEAENARLRGEVQGLRFALEAVSKGVPPVPASALRSRPASSVA